MGCRWYFCTEEVRSRTAAGEERVEASKHRPRRLRCCFPGATCLWSDGPSPSCPRRPRSGSCQYQPHPTASPEHCRMSQWVPYVCDSTFSLQRPTASPHLCGREKDGGLPEAPHANCQDLCRRGGGPWNEGCCSAEFNRRAAWLIQVAQCEHWRSYTWKAGQRRPSPRDAGEEEPLSVLPAVGVERSGARGRRQLRELENGMLPWSLWKGKPPGQQGASAP